MENLTLVFLVAGLVLLVAGAELLVRGASGIAAAAGLSPLVIGLTVVAYGTSAPELAVSVRSAIVGQPDIALGNVVGSNIFNVLFILGVSAFLTPLIVQRQLVRVDVPIMIGASAVAYSFSQDHRFDRWEGAVFLGAGVLYTLLALWLGRRGQADGEPAAPPGAPKKTKPRIGVSLLLVAIGLALLVLGAEWLVRGAVEIARGLGVSELVIGLTIVAAGTSLPEVATSIVAAIRGERDIAVGNVVGSNIFNLLFVLGGAATIAPAGIDVSSKALAFDIPVMIGVAIVCLPIFFTGWRIARPEGLVFLAFYGLYTTYLVLEAKGSASVIYESLVLWVVIPLVATVLLAQSVRFFFGGHEEEEAARA